MSDEFDNIAKARSAGEIDDKQMAIKLRKLFSQYASALLSSHAKMQEALRVIAWPLLHTEAEREAHIEILLKYLNDRQPEGRRVVALPGECYLRALIGVAAIGLKREQR